MVNAILQTAAGNPENQDRGVVINCGTRLVLVVADGAGGLSGAAQAATRAVELVQQEAAELKSSAACVRLLQQMDQAIARRTDAGETTCTLCVAIEDEVFGASVGDSGAWLIDKNKITDLTHRQSRKPFIGSGSAWPVPFSHARPSTAPLLLASDGLLKYSSQEQIAAVCRAYTGGECARRLIELVRYPSGNLPDDVTVIVAL